MHASKLLCCHITGYVSESIACKLLCAKHGEIVHRDSSATAAAVLCSCPGHGEAIRHAAFSCTAYDRGGAADSEELTPEEKAAAKAERMVENKLRKKKNNAPKRITKIQVTHELSRRALTHHHASSCVFVHASSDSAPVVL